MYRILLIAIVLILYGSLFPWQYNSAHAHGNPILLLIDGWQHHVRGAFIGDVIVNLLLYAPIGMFGYLAMVQHRHARLRFAGPVLLGFVLSTLIEIAQIYDISRDSSLLDVACNTIGTAMGVVLGIIFRESLLASLRRQTLARGLHPSGPLVLLFVWIGFQILPVFPLSTHVRGKLNMLLHPHFSAVDLLAMFAAWLIVGRLLEAMYSRDLAASVLLALSVLAPAKIVIAQRAPTPSELLGTVLALIVWWFVISRWRGNAGFLGMLALLAVVLKGLMPFHFTSAAAPFGWIPFVSLIDAERESSLVMLCYKSFFYGAAVWLLWSSRRKLLLSTLTVAAVLTAIEVAQMYLPGHVSETTDPILALIFGTIFWLLETHGRRTQRAVPVKRRPAPGLTHVPR